MFKSKYGAFNGGSWEALCQLIFKKKFEIDGYQQIPASPGDFGIEGFTLSTGWAFQCYCPDKHYGRKELYEKQRDKITEDLKKLESYRVELAKRLGQTKLQRWIFVTPEFDKNDLIAHARTKERLVRSWGLPFISDNFEVLIFDADNFYLEINAILSAAGETLVLGDVVAELTLLDKTPEEYEENVRRKSTLRLFENRMSANFDNKLKTLHKLTLTNFLSADGYFRDIESSAPVLYLRLVRLINEFEHYVVETSVTWLGSAEALTTQVRDELERRIVEDFKPQFDHAAASKVARFMVARWLAICELDYE